MKVNPFWKWDRTKNEILVMTNCTFDPEAFAVAEIIRAVTGERFPERIVGGGWVRFPLGNSTQSVAVALAIEYPGEGITGWVARNQSPNA